MTTSWLRNQLFLLPLLPFLALACGGSQNDSIRPPDDGGFISDDGGAPGDDVASEGGEEVGDASTEDAGTAEGGDASDATFSPAAAAGLAVIHGDKSYTASLLSLVDPVSGTLIRDNCLNSGTVAPGLSKALSGDVVLPSAPLPGNPLILIDRGNSNLIWVDPVHCTAIRQINVGQGFMANPHDVLAVTASKIYVTRYGSNPKPATPLDGGGDLLVLDPDQSQPLSRIDLAPLASAPGVNPNPDRGQVLGGKLFVTLNNFSADFSKAGPGRVVIVDPATDTVTGSIDLPGLKNCGAIVPVPGRPASLAIACAGAFADGADQIKASGIAIVDTSASPPSVTSLTATSFGRPVSGSDLAMINANLGLVVVPGDFSGKPADQMWSFDLAAGLPHMILESQAAFVLGGLVFDRISQRVFVGDADATTPRVRVFDVSGPSPHELPSISSDPEKGLLPRSVGLY